MAPNLPCGLGMSNSPLFSPATCAQRPNLSSLSSTQEFISSFGAGKKDRYGFSGLEFSVVPGPRPLAVPPVFPPAKRRYAAKDLHWRRDARGDAQGMFEDALRHFRAGRVDEAVSGYRRAIALKPDYAEAHNNLGVALAAQGRIDEAVSHCRRAIVLKPDDAEAHNNLGTALCLQGKFDEATVQYGRAISIRPAYAEAHFNRAEIKTFRQGDPDQAALEALAGGDSLPAEKLPFIHFALAKALEDNGEYGRAFEHLRTGNASKRGQIDYNEAAMHEFFQRISNVFSAGVLDRLQGGGDPSQAPIFVLGMPRSGSTLIEQVLASHPQIHGAGELVDLGKAASAVLNDCNPLFQFPECIPSLDGAALRRIGESYLARLPVPGPGKTRIVDKLPNNFFFIGLIRLVLPNARIIHSVRHPVDTCVSCYSKLFASAQKFTYDLGELGRYYRSYSGLMAHWKSVLSPEAILDVAYEDVVDDLEGEARRLIDYCGLPWDDRCLTFHRTRRPVKTASAAQVRKPLYRSSLERWRKYEGNLGPLLDELGELVPRHASGRTYGTLAAHTSA
jgi:Tfp pilus assembly protein PilF